MLLAAGWGATDKGGTGSGHGPTSGCSRRHPDPRGWARGAAPGMVWQHPWVFLSRHLCCAVLRGAQNASSAWARLHHARSLTLSCCSPRICSFLGTGPKNPPTRRAQPGRGVFLSASTTRAVGREGLGLSSGGFGDFHAGRCCTPGTLRTGPSGVFPALPLYHRSTTSRQHPPARREVHPGNFLPQIPSPQARSGRQPSVVIFNSPSRC